MMKQITKSEFVELFIKHATPADSGWNPDHWKTLEKYHETETKWMYQEPQSPQHDRLYLVCGCGENRMFFMTDESDEAFFDHPGKE